MTAGALTVLHLAANRWWTGSADPTIQLASAQQARGHRVLLAVPPGDRFEAKAREAGLTLVEGFHLRARLASLQIARDAVWLRRVAREQAVDVMHAHHSHDHWLALLARPRSGGRRPPVARTFHALRAVKRDAVSRRLYRRTDAALAVSRQIEARCREAGVPPERVYWTPGMADLPRFAAEADGRVVWRAVGEWPEPVAYGETGLLVEGDLPEAVAWALRSVLTDRARARAMGAAGRRRAEKEFSPARAVETVERAYRGFLGH